MKDILRETVRRLESSRDVNSFVAYARQGVKVDRSYEGVNVDICENGATYIIDSKTDEVLEMLPTTFPEQDVRRG